MLKQISHLIFIIFLSTLLFACGGGGSNDKGASAASQGITVSPLSITLAENTSTTFTVVLNTEPANDVTINISSNDANETAVDQPV